jgi:uncharacterized membrane protein HdeD (DUF308 family)
MTEISGFSLEERETLEDATSLWWLFLITGTLWLLVSWLVLRWDYSTVASVSYLFGAMAIFLGVNEFFQLGGSTAGWKIFHGILGVLFIAGGIYALFDPFSTFAALASLVGLFFIVKGAFDVIVSIATRGESPIWWLQLIVGILELIIGFWASGPGYETYGRQVVLLVVFVGFLAMARGITEIIFAFKLRSAGKKLAAA